MCDPKHRENVWMRSRNYLNPNTPNIAQRVLRNRLMKNKTLKSDARVC